MLGGRKMDCFFSIMVYTDTSKGKFQSKTELINPSNCINSQLFGTSFAHTCPVIGVTCGHLEWSVRMPRCTCRRVRSLRFKASGIHLICEILSCWLNLLWVQIFLGNLFPFLGGFSIWWKICRPFVVGFSL